MGDGEPEAAAAIAVMRLRLLAVAGRMVGAIGFGGLGMEWVVWDVSRGKTAYTSIGVVEGGWLEAIHEQRKRCWYGSVQRNLFLTPLLDGYGSGKVNQEETRRSSASTVFSNRRLSL